MNECMIVKAFRPCCPNDLNDQTDRMSVYRERLETRIEEDRVWVDVNWRLPFPFAAQAPLGINQAPELRSYSSINHQTIRNHCHSMADLVLGVGDLNFGITPSDIQTPASRLQSIRRIR